MKSLITFLKGHIRLLLYVSFLTLITCASSTAQERNVTGTVISAEDNLPVKGVNILVKGKTTGAITDENGNFSITITGDDSILVFSFFGFDTQEIAVGNQSVLNIIMIPKVPELGDTIVTSLGIIREKQALTYSAQAVATEDIAKARDLNVINYLSGKVAGLEIIRSNSGVGSPTRVVIRGNRSIAGNNQPLYIVDGAPIDNSSGGPNNDWGFYKSDNAPINNTGGGPDSENGGVAWGDGIGNINPEDIESITILKGPSATALYGTRGNNGAIMITTKKGTARKGVGVEYSLNYTVETPVILTKLQNVYGQGSEGIYSKNSQVDWGPKMDGRMVEHWTSDPNSPDFGTTYPFVAHPDNLRDFFQTETNIANSIALTTGSKKIQGYFSYTNARSRGIIQGNDLKRHNFNTRLTGNLSRKLSFDTKITYFYQTVNNRVVTGDHFSNPMRAILRQPSNISLEQAKNFEYHDNEGFLLQNYWSPPSLS